MPTQIQKPIDTLATIKYYKVEEKQMKVCVTCGVEIATKDGDNLCLCQCQNAIDAGFKAQQKRRRIARRNRRKIDDAMKSLGLVKVKGAMGGAYWE